MKRAMWLSQYKPTLSQVQELQRRYPAGTFYFLDLSGHDGPLNKYQRNLCLRELTAKVRASGIRCWR